MSIDTNNSGNLIVLQENCGVVSVENDLLMCRIEAGSDKLFNTLVRKQTGQGPLSGSLVGYIQQEKKEAGVETYENYKFTGVTEKVTVEQADGKRAVIKVEGTHKVLKTGATVVPYVIYLCFSADSDEIVMKHYFEYAAGADGETLRGIAVELTMAVAGSLHNRHVGFVCETGMLYDGVQPMYVGSGIWGKKNPKKNNGGVDERVLMYERQQLDGQFVTIDMEEFADFAEIVEDNASFTNFRLTQNSGENYVITKCAKPGCAYITAVQGTRSQGTMFVGSEAGIIAAGVKDCWQKSPMTLEVKGMTTDEAVVTLWLVSRYAQKKNYSNENKVYLKLFAEMPGKQPIVDFAAKLNQ